MQVPRPEHCDAQRAVDSVVVVDSNAASTASGEINQTNSIAIRSKQSQKINRKQHNNNNDYYYYYNNKRIANMLLTGTAEQRVDVVSGLARAAIRRAARTVTLWVRVGGLRFEFD